MSTQQDKKKITISGNENILYIIDAFRFHTGINLQFEDDMKWGDEFEIGYKNDIYDDQEYLNSLEIGELDNWDPVNKLKDYIKFLQSKRKLSIRFDNMYEHNESDCTELITEEITRINGLIHKHNDDLDMHKKCEKIKEKTGNAITPSKLREFYDAKSRMDTTNSKIKFALDN